MFLWRTDLATLTLLAIGQVLLSADAFYKQFDPECGPTECRTQAGYKLRDILMVFSKELNL